MQIWTRALKFAAQTPPERNRYVDFLRAISILVVIFGHWLITTAYYTDNALSVGHLFEAQPWTQWLTWIFQVMPVFFIVGGYSNAVSLDSARRRQLTYADWLAGRLHRLVIPLLLVLLFWMVLTAGLDALGIERSILQLGSQVALIPTWFLAIYIMVVVLAPLMYRCWRRLGFVAFWLLVALAVAMDLVFFAVDLRWPAWSNYFWVWLAIHMLGFAWRDARFGGAGRLLLYSMLGVATLWVLVRFGPYPLAMVGSPGQTLSNNTPPKITLLALAVFQFGLLLALERPLRVMLDNLYLWAATVLINGMIMSIYLWHATVSVIFIGLLYLGGGVGLGLEPGSAAWWWSRLPWLLLLAGLLVPVAMLVSPLERIARDPAAAACHPVRQVIGAMMTGLGIAMLAMFGYGGGPVAWLGFLSFTLVVGGAAVGGLLPGLRLQRD